MITPATFVTLAQDPVSGFLFGKGGRAAGQAGSEIAPAVDSLFMVIFWVSMFSFFLLMGLTLYFVFKYRAKPGVPGQRSPSHNTPLELFWSIVPLLVMIWFFFEGFWGYVDMQTAKAGAEPIAVQAQMWNWGVTYPNGASSRESTQVGGKEQPVIVVPAGMPVKLTMNSIDVIHSFWVPAFRTKRDVFPNRYTTLAFEPNPIAEDDPWHESEPDEDKPFRSLRYQYRDHYVFCAEFCGDQHSEMAAIIRVVEPDVYATIVDDWSKIDPTAPPEEQLDFWSRRHGCISCHSMDGSPGTGPTWLNLYGNQFTYNTGSKVVDENHIRSAIYDPAADVRDGFPNQMTSYVGIVTEEQLAVMIRGLQAISNKGPSSIVDPANQPPAGEGGGESGG